MVLDTTSIQIQLNLEWTKAFMMLDFCATQIGPEGCWTQSSLLYWLFPHTSIACTWYAAKGAIDFNANWKLGYNKIF